MNQRRAIQAMEGYLDSQGWHYDTSSDKIELGMKLQCKLKHCDIKILFSDNDYEVYVYVDDIFKADEDSMAMMLEYLTRANYGLADGNFELDVRDGEIRYKSYVAYSDATRELDMTVLRQSIQCPLAMIEKYGDGIVRIAMGVADSAEAEIKEAEK